MSHSQFHGIYCLYLDMHGLILPPRLPKRRAVNRVLSSSPDEDGPRLPTWQAAQEEEARAKSSFIDEDMGV